MVILTTGGPRVGWIFLRCLQRKRAMLVPGAIGAVGLPQMGPRASAVRLRSRRAWRLLRPLLAYRSTVANVGSLRPGCSGGGWVFVPSLTPPSVLPRSARSRCGPSMGYIIPGILSYSSVSVP